MKLFKRMNKKESFNSKKGMIFGFYAYLLVLAVNNFYYLLTDKILFSPSITFWSGLVAFLVFELILNLKDKYNKKDSDN